MKLQEVCHLIVDCPHSTAPDEGCGIPLIRTPNIGFGRFNMEGVHRVSEKVYQARCARAIPQNDDIIFAREAPAGNAAIIKNNEKMCLGQRTVLIRPNPEKVCPDFLVYYLLASEQQYKLLGTANGATVAHVNLPIIREMNVDNLPPIEVQRKIADVLSAYDDLIENNRKQIKLLEEAAQRLYKEWFIDLRFPGYENTKIINGIPEGWEMRVLGDIACESGKTVKKENRDNYECYLPIDCLPSKSLVYTMCNDVSLAESSLSSFNHGDIIFGAMRPYFHKIVIAYNKGLTRSTCFVINCFENAFWSFLVMTLFSTGTIEYATQISVGTTMPYVRWKDFQQMPLLIPNKSIAEKFNIEFMPISKKLVSLSKQINALQMTRDRLLPKLMTGELEVNHD